MSKSIKIEIDVRSGFCHGVIRAIRKAEQELNTDKSLYCLGEIVHNSEEVSRLNRKGLQTIDKEQFMQLKDTKVLFRAHGEPPEVYDIARRNNITVVDASCGVVLALQQKIRKAHEESPDAQIVILGKKGHAEVIGLEGQIGYSDIVIENESDLNKIDFSRQIILFSQTTKSVEEFNSIVAKIKENLKEGVDFRYYDTICRQVSNRIPELKEFASRYELIIFVSGKNSSNGKVLFDVCRSVNPNTMFVASLNDIDFYNIEHFSSIGICGATSTPIWLMEAVKEKIEHYFTSSDKNLNKKI